MPKKAKGGTYWEDRIDALAKGEHPGKSHPKSEPWKSKYEKVKDCPARTNSLSRCVCGHDHDWSNRLQSSRQHRQPQVVPASKSQPTILQAFKGGLRQASDDQGASSVIPRAPVPVLETQESDRSAAAEPSADTAPEVQESPNVDPPTESLRSRSDVPVVSIAVAAVTPVAVSSSSSAAGTATVPSPPPQDSLPRKWPRIPEAQEGWILEEVAARGGNLSKMTGWIDPVNIDHSAKRAPLPT